MTYEIKEGEVYEKIIQYIPISLEELEVQLTNKINEKQKFMDSFDNEILELKNKISMIKNII